jgi:serine/threonine-protein kinase HipA
LDFELAFEVISYFRISQKRANEIINEVMTSVGNWREKAEAIGISRAEQERMKPAFYAVT